MTALIEKIRQDSLAARKARDTLKATFLVTLLAEASKVGKDDGNRESTDSEVVAVVKKFAKNNEMTLASVGTAEASTEVRKALEMEQAILAAYLPKQVDLGELRAAIVAAVSRLETRNPKQMGAVMAELKSTLGDTFDKAIASKLVKEALTG